MHISCTLHLSCESFVNFTVIKLAILNEQEDCMHSMNSLTPRQCDIGETSAVHDE